MNTQPNLFSAYPDTLTRQPALFDLDTPAASTARCAECGRQLVPTPAGYLCCPMGHGRLIADAVELPGAELCGALIELDPADLARWVDDGGRP